MYVTHIEKLSWMEKWLSNEIFFLKRVLNLPPAIPARFQFLRVSDDDHKELTYQLFSGSGGNAQMIQHHQNSPSGQVVWEGAVIGVSDLRVRGAGAVMFMYSTDYWLWYTVIEGMKIPSRDSLYWIQKKKKLVYTYTLKPNHLMNEVLLSRIILKTEYQRIPPMKNMTLPDLQSQPPPNHSKGPKRALQRVVLSCAAAAAAAAALLTCTLEPIHTL